MKCRVARGIRLGQFDVVTAVVATVRLLSLRLSFVLFLLLSILRSFISLLLVSLSLLVFKQPVSVPLAPQRVNSKEIPAPENVVLHHRGDDAHGHGLHERVRTEQRVDAVFGGLRTRVERFLPNLKRNPILRLVAVRPAVALRGGDFLFENGQSGVSGGLNRGSRLVACPVVRQ